MVDSPARIRCEVCGEQNIFDNESPKGVFSYSPCQGCEFPLLYRNTNPNQHALNRRTFEKYAEAAQLWGVEIQADKKTLQASNEALKSKNHELKHALNLESGKNLTSENANAHGTPVEKSHISELEQFIQNIGDRLNLIEDKLPDHESRLLTSIQTVSKLIQHMQAFENRFSSFERSQHTIQALENRVENIESLAQKGSGQIEARSIVILPEQKHLEMLRWVRSYNENDPDSFVARSSAKRAGATKETMEANRLGMGGDAIFEVGNGRYWLATFENQNAACLVPNRKTLRLNPNTIASLKIGFELTHDRSLQSLDFDARNANMTNIELIYPAILDMAERDTLWQLRQKGVLLFPVNNDQDQ